MKTKCEYCDRSNKAGRETCKSCGAPLSVPRQVYGYYGGEPIYDQMNAILLSAQSEVEAMLGSIVPPRPPRVSSDLQVCKR